MTRGEISPSSLRSRSRSRHYTRRGSYFFVIDAFIASAILLLTVVFLYTFFLGQRPPEQSFNYANDFLNFLTATEVRDYQEANITLMVLDGNITDTSVTLAEQLLIFHNQSRPDLARRIIASAALILPTPLALSVNLVNNTDSISLYNRSSGNNANRRTHLVVRTIEYVLLNETTLMGPLVLEVEVWS